jgi:prevent-host-death family protein
MTKTWTVQDAKTHLSEVLRRARAGEPQRIGVADACVVISASAWAAHADADLGSWLVSSAPRGAPLPAAERSSRRGDPFGPAGDGDHAS